MQTNRLTCVVERELNVEPSIALKVGRKRLTTRQLEVIQAVQEEGSQNRAAHRLGISTSVLNRYLGQIEGKLGQPLLAASPTGTVLNETGERIAQEFKALEHRLRRGGEVVVGGTIITEELLLNTLSRVDPQGETELILSDDRRNLKDFQAGLMDILLVDDPLYLFELEEVRWQEIATDRLIHIDNGPRYARFAYGAQRIGFQSLDAEGVEYSVEGNYRSVPALLASGRSFFINESLVLRRGLRLRSATDPSKLEHRINAIYRKETPFVRKVVSALRREGRTVSPK